MIKIYSSKDCIYCNDLKNKLKNEKIEYIDIDVDDDVNEEESNKLFEFIGKPLIPIIVKKPHLLVPTKSFNTIDEAIVLIKSLK